MRHFPHPLRISLLAAALAATALLPVASSAAQTASADQPAGPLDHALTTFASQRGIALSFEPGLTQGRQAPALHGPIGDRQGLEQLLAGSGLRLIQRADGSYTLAPAPAASSGVIPLSPLRIGAQRTFPYSEGMELGQDDIERSVKGNGDLGTLLRINPAVQFSDTGQTSRNMGEIRPADISINGAPFYQNLFLLDGVSFNNDIDPAATATSNNNINVVADVPSQSQGIAVDTDLIEKLTVYDSNVPASYGGFTGGVVEATSRKAGDTLHGKVWFRMARSAWDQVIIPDGQETTWQQAATFAYQSVYDKSKLGARLEGRTASGIGLIGTVTRTRSEIPLRGYAGGNVSATDANTKTQTRQNTAASLAADWHNDDGLELSANFNYAPTEDTYFLANTKDSWFTIKSGGPVLALRASLQRGAWKSSHALSYSDIESSRHSQVDYYRSWGKSPAYDWGTNNSSAEGSWGNIEQHDRKIGYRAVADRDTFDWGHTQHTVQMGLSFQRRQAQYHRLNNQYYYGTSKATTSCTLSDGSVDTESCSLSPVYTSTSNALIAGRGQYFTRFVLYREGQFEVSGDQWSGWLQDDIRIGNWSLRPGLRVDGDSIWTQTTLSPRMAASWDVFGDRDTTISGGLNRYYGRNFFTYLLREGREALMVTKVRTSSSTSWDDVVGTTASSSNRISDVDIPYTDEWTVGLDQRWAGMTINLKYVDRNNHDEVRRQQVKSGDTSGTYSTNVYEYTNNGQSHARTWTLSVGLQNPLRWGASSTQLQLALDHTDVQRNYTDYDDVWSLAESTELVRYKGQLAWLYDLPATNFNRPWTARLSSQTRLPLGPGELMLSHFLRFRSGYRDIGFVGYEDYEGTTIDVYDQVDYPKSFTWDSAIEYALQIAPQQHAYVRVEANNVLNRSTLITGTTVSSREYEPGRSYWLEVGYRF